jgi:hypothetical protein
MVSPIAQFTTSAAAIVKLVAPADASDIASPDGVLLAP